jgi:hypothetical protein
LDDEQNRIVEQLIKVYTEELELYRRFIALSEELAEKATGETAPEEIERLIGLRQSSLDGIAGLERSIDSQKEAWRNSKGDLPGDRQGLKSLLEEVRLAVERTIELDQRIQTDINVRLQGFKGDMDHLRLTRKAQKAYTKRNDGPNSGITRAKA